MGTKRDQTNYEAWTPEEVEVLKEMYQQWPIEYDRLPGRARQQIHSKAYRLGLSGRRSVENPYSEIVPTEWAYLAGIVDGEGTIGLYETGLQEAGKTIRGARREVSVANTDLALIAWLRSTFPESGIQTQPPDLAFGRKVSVHHVRWTRAGALRYLLLGMLPYLIVKKEKALRLLAHIDGHSRFSALT